MSDEQDRMQQIQDAHWTRSIRTRRTPSHPVVRAVFEPLSDIVASTVDEPGTASALDVGCGNGFLQWSMERRFDSVAGVDYSQRMLEMNPCREKHLGTCLDLAFEDKSFDVVVAANLLHHLAEPDRARTIAEMKRVARCSVVSFEPNRNNPLALALALISPEGRMGLQFSAPYMRALFSGAGLHGVRGAVRGWIVPNRAPAWWIPIGRALDRTPLGRIGFYICTVGNVE